MRCAFLLPVQLVSASVVIRGDPIVLIASSTLPVLTIDDCLLPCVQLLRLLASARAPLDCCRALRGTEMYYLFWACQCSLWGPQRSSVVRIVSYCSIGRYARFSANNWLLHCPRLLASARASFDCCPALRSNFLLLATYPPDGIC